MPEGQETRINQRSERMQDGARGGDVKATFGATISYAVSADFVLVSFGRQPKNVLS